ncbi:MAG: tetratricopeptide repeat protein [Vicingaceae bacterium]
MSWALRNISQKKAIGLIVICGFLLYANTLGHDYTLDDAIVITENDFTKKGFSGIWEQLSNDQFVGFYGQKKELVSGGRYRPLSMVMFNLEYAFFGNSPFIGHLMNVLWYLLNGVLLFLVLQKLFPEKWENNPWLPLSLLATLLWVFHPIHSEVVANIKGRDEIMAFCGELFTLWLLLKWLDSKKISLLITMAGVYFLALLSKENAITWLAIFPLAIYFFKKEKIQQAIPAFAVLLAVAGGWFAIRYQVVGGGIKDVADNLMNDPFLESTVSEKYATIMLTLGKYVQLLFFPHPLTYDYYPKHIPIVSWNNPMVILSAFLYLGLIILSMVGFLKRKLYGFGILIFFITLSIASNLIFPIGAFMNERFVYVSSLGFCLVLGQFLLFGLSNFIKKIKQKQQALTFLCLLIFSLYSVKTISRNLVWKNNLTLATHDAEISVNGAKSNVMAGGLLTEEAAKSNNPAEKRKLLIRGIKYLERAIKVYPEYIDALLLMGNAQWELTKEAKNAMPYYKKILSINPNNQNAWSNILIVLEQEKNTNFKLKAYEELQRINPQVETVYVNMGRAYGKEKNDLNKALDVFQSGLQRFPNSYQLLSNMGTVYGLQGNYAAAIQVLEKATQIQPNNSKAFVDLGLSYYYNQQLQQAKAAFDKAKQIDPNLDRTKFPV